MSPKQVIKTSNAPNPVGPYNQAIKAGDFIYCSGQIAIDPVLNEITCLGNIENPPARACVEVSSLPKGVLVEIDCVAFLD